MKLIDYLKALPAGGRESLASACDTSLGHLRNVAYGYRPCAPELAVRIEVQAHGVVTRRDLRPDDWAQIWPELAQGQEIKAVGAIKNEAGRVAHA